MLGVEKKPKFYFKGDLLKENKDYIYHEKKSNYSLKGNAVEFDLEYSLEGKGNFKGNYSPLEHSAYNILGGNIVDRNDPNFNYSYINKKLNGALDKYLVDVNKVSVNYNGSYYEHPKIPFTLNYTESNPDIQLYPNEDFTYKKSGNNWIITGIGRFCGTRTITK